MQWSLIVIFLFVGGCSDQSVDTIDSASSDSLPPPKIIKEQSGKIINFRIEGSLAATRKVGCIALDEVKNNFTPPDLHQGLAAYLREKNWHRAFELFAVAGAYATFDAKRVTDKSAGQARSVLLITTLSKFSQEDKKIFLNKVAAERAANDVLLCSQIAKIGAPNYYLRYMILHGAQAFVKERVR